MSGISSRPLRSRSRLLLTAAALATSAVLLSACGGSSGDATESAAPAAAADEELVALLPEQIASSGALSLGALWETPPMIGVDASDTNVAVGIAPDLAAIVGEYLGLEPEWHNMQWPAQLPGVLSGQVDALWGQVTGTAEREGSEYDQIPFYKTTDALLLSAEVAEDIQGLKDMCGLTIGTGVGSVYLETIAAASEAFCADTPIQTAEYQGATAAISAVRAGTVEAWIDSTSNQIAAAEASDGVFAAVEIPEDEAPASFTTITVSKDLPGLSEALAGALRLAIEDGSYQKVLEEYGVAAAAVTVDEVVINPYTGLAAGERA